jgi:hypothetical protein
VKETATTTSDTHDLPHEHGKKTAAKLAHHQRMMARQKSPKGKPHSGTRGYHFVTISRPFGSRPLPTGAVCASH